MKLYRQNLVRMLGGLIWIAIPAILFMLFLPHEIAIDYRMTFLFLFLILLVNFTAMFLPLREGTPGWRFGLLASLFGLSLIALLCAAIYYSGGIWSPLFTFFLLATAFSTSLFSSLTSAALISLVSAGSYLVTLLASSGLHSGDIQTVCMQVFFLLLVSFFINRLSVESREQARERARAMEELRSLSQMDRAASSFVSAVSFEMRTPLTSILGFSELLASIRLPPEKEREYVEIISREADNLSRLVEDLLDISRLESGKVQLSREAAHLEHLLDMSLPLLEPACDPSRVVVNLPADLPAVMVDTQRMKRVFDSVFGYIVRTSGRDTELRVSAKAEGRQVVITLNMRNRDTARLRENGGRIFPPPGEPDRDDLELAMARRIVLAHQGSINLIQTSGGWFTIVLRLPELTDADFASSPPHPFDAFEER